MSDEVSPLPPLLEQIYETGEVEDEHGGRHPARPTSIARDEALALARCVRDHGASRTLEVGMAYGLSTLALAGAHEGVHLAIDPFQRSDWRSIGILNVARAGLEGGVRVIERRSDEALADLVARGEQFDLAFVDGLHLFDATLVDFHFADRLLDVGGRVALHDLWMPSVRAAVDFIAANRAYEPTREGTDNLLVLRKTAGDDRPWDHFVAPRRRRRGPSARRP
ncbi:MAG: class I SAM-dependent methyltransferase [Solirubrobacteraceae bacterium]